MAPFPNTTDNGGSHPTFRNLTIDGSIYEAYSGNEEHHHVGGLIGHLYGTVTIEHCTSNVSITSTGGAGGFVGNCESTVRFTDCVSHATIRSAGGSNSGFVGWSRSNDNDISFEGCLFNGKLLKVNDSSKDNGGFIGWKGDSKTVTITNSICAPAALANGETMADGNSATFSREHANYAASITNSYYTETFGTAQGLGYSFASAPANISTAGTAYTTSDITPYTRGLLYGGLYYMTPEAVSLADNAANDVTSMAGYFADVTLTGRKLWKDGNWNTLCLPFDVALTGSYFEGATVMELGNSTGCNTGFDAKTGTLSLDFVDAHSINAGHAYIVKWTTTGDPIENPVFHAVTIRNEDPADQSASSRDGSVTFKGTYDVIPFTATDRSVLFLGSNNKLYWPQPDLSDPAHPVYPNIGAFRAYFQLNGGITASDVANARLSFGEDSEAQGITTTNYTNFTNSSGAWYTLDGVKLDKMPTRKGLYIQNGRVVVVK